jgi:hypothetical protein
MGPLQWPPGGQASQVHWVGFVNVLFKYWSFLHSLALRHFKSVQNDWPGVSCLYP